MISLKSLQLLIASFILILAARISIAYETFEVPSLPSQLEYRPAANYTNLKWRPQLESVILIKTLPILNFSGIPIQKRNEQSDYYSHGKIPQEIQTLFSDLVSTSRYFYSIEPTGIKDSRLVADYQFQLVVENYQLPFDYAPDDIWWKELNADVDRWFVKPRNANIKLSLKIMSGARYLSTWSQSIEVTLSECDLNRHTQPLTSKQNTNKTINEYVKTTLGQAFIAASNYLILQAIHHVNQEHRIAKVIRNDHNELFIVSENGSFLAGEKLEIYYDPDGGTQSTLPAGKIEIIKTYKNQAVAYPVDIRIDQIKSGDWIKMSQVYPYQNPRFSFNEKNSCAQVKVAENDRAH